MADLLLQWNPDTFSGDLVFANGDIQTGGGINDLSTSVMISIFTNPSWFGNSYMPFPIGSDLYKLYRSKLDNNTLLLAQNAVVNSLQWLKSYGIASSVTCTAISKNGNTLVLTVNITEPSGNTQTFNYSQFWGGTINAGITPTFGALDVNFVLDSSKLS